MFAVIGNKWSLLCLSSAVRTGRKRRNVSRSTFSSVIFRQKACFPRRLSLQFQNTCHIFAHIFVISQKGKHQNEPCYFLRFCGRVSCMFKMHRRGQQSFWGTFDTGLCLKAPHRWWAAMIRQAKPEVICTREAASCPSVICTDKGYIFALCVFSPHPVFLYCGFDFDVAEMLSSCL